MDIQHCNRSVLAIPPIGAAESLPRLTVLYCFIVIFVITLAILIRLVATGIELSGFSRWVSARRVVVTVAADGATAVL